MIYFNTLSEADRYEIAEALSLETGRDVEKCFAVLTAENLLFKYVEGLTGGWQCVQLRLYRTIVNSLKA